MKDKEKIRQFGLEVRRRRLALGFSQEEFADHASLHRTYVSDIERGGRNPTVSIVFQLASALGCEPSELFITSEQ